MSGPEDKSIAVPTANVLLVDDRPDGLLALEAVLASPDLNLVKASSGQEAIARLASQDFAVVLLDVQMPGMDGFETATIIRRNHWSREVPIIFITAINLDAKHVFRGYESGCVDYLFKPIDPFILKSKVEIFVELYRKNVRIREQARLLSERTNELLKVNQSLQTEMMERVRAEKEMLTISNREQMRFGRDLHDGLAQRLTGILFMTKALQQTYPQLETKNPKISEITELVRQAIVETNGLARGMNPVSLELNGLVAALNELASSTIKLFGVRCRCRSDSSMRVDDAALALNLYRIAQEAIHNAVKHGKARDIEISLTREGPGRAKLSIKDDGIGFSSANGAPADGMGLRNMKHRAKLIGASLQILAQHNKGTVVECLFEDAPLHKRRPLDSGMRLGPTVKVEPAGASECKRVLVVEDHPVVRRWLTELVNQQPDLKVCGEADDGGEALQMISEIKPHVVLVDVSLKDSNGIDLVRQIAARFEGVSSLVVSMHDEKTHAEEALRAGARGYAMKEDAAENMVTAIRAILSGRLYVSGSHGPAIIKRIEEAQSEEFQRAAVG